MLLDMEEFFFLFHLSSIITCRYREITCYYCAITCHYRARSGTYCTRSAIYHSFGWSYRLVQIVPYSYKRLSEQLEGTIRMTRRDYSDNPKVTPKYGRCMEDLFSPPYSKMPIFTRIIGIFMEVEEILKYFLGNQIIFSYFCSH